MTEAMYSIGLLGEGISGWVGVCANAIGCHTEGGISVMLPARRVGVWTSAIGSHTEWEIRVKLPTGVEFCAFLLCRSVRCIQCVSWRFTFLNQKR